MRRRHPRALAFLAGLAALLVVLMAGLSLADGSGDRASASRAALQRIAAKNREAAIVSAAGLKARSDAAAAAADARLAATTERNAAQPVP